MPVRRSISTTKWDPEFIKLGIGIPQDAYDYAAMIGCGLKRRVGGKWGYRCAGMSFINSPVMLGGQREIVDAPAASVLPQRKSVVGR